MLSETFFKKLVDDEVDDGLANAPPRCGQSLPEAGGSALLVDPAHHHGEAAVRPVQLQPRLHQPDGVGQAAADEPCKGSSTSLRT